MEAGGWEACVILLLSLSASFSVSLICGFQLLTCLGGGACVCVGTSKPKATFYGDVVKGKCTLTHLIYPKTLDMSGLKLLGQPSCHLWQALMVQ